MVSTYKDFSMKKNTGCRSGDVYVSPSQKAGKITKVNKPKTKGKK
jgi:hypothetical protein